MAEPRIATEPCAAGRTAFFGGRWTVLDAHDEIGRHVIGSPGGVVVHLCDKHFAEVNAAGLVTEPNIGEEELERRMGRRPTPVPWCPLCNTRHPVDTPCPP